MFLYNLDKIRNFQRKSMEIRHSEQSMQGTQMSRLYTEEYTCLMKIFPLHTVAEMTHNTVYGLHCSGCVGRVPCIRTCRGSVSVSPGEVPTPASNLMKGVSQL